MADPILPDFYRVQTVLEGFSLLPEDVYVNSWCFRDDTDLGAEIVATTAADTLLSFFNDVHAPGTVPIASFLSNRALTGKMTVKTYALGQAPPRTPMERVRTLTGLDTAVAVPSEVSLCLSFYAERNVPRQRGRVYIGPFGSDALHTLTAGPSRPIAGLINALAGAGAWLEDEGIGGVNWHVLSPTDGVAREVTGGWVDDAWDTQRRRGEDASGRTAWGNPAT